MEAQMKNKITQIEQFINTMFQPVVDSIKYSRDMNTPIMFDSGSFGESLVCLVFDSKGSGTQGGASFDDSHGREVKTLFKLGQSKQCIACNWKNSFFSETCHDCGGKNFKHANDTRAGISCGSHFRYYDELGDYIIIEFTPDIEDHTCRSATLRGWIIKKDNQFFNSMLQTQKEAGADNKNLLTSSVEFAMSAPSKFIEVKIDFSKTVKSTVSHFSPQYDVKNVSLVPRTRFVRQYRKFQDLITDSQYNPVYNSLDILAIAGTQGKKRGIVSRKNIQKEMA